MQVQVQTEVCPSKRCYAATNKEINADVQRAATSTSCRIAGAPVESIRNHLTERNPASVHVNNPDGEQKSDYDSKTQGIDLSVVPVLVPLTKIYLHVSSRNTCFWND